LEGASNMDNMDNWDGTGGRDMVGVVARGPAGQNQGLCGTGCLVRGAFGCEGASGRIGPLRFLVRRCVLRGWQGRFLSILGERMGGGGVHNGASLGFWGRGRVKGGLAGLSGCLRERASAGKNRWSEQ
jgi:hypothetical protein